jgi:predicted DNA-binding protein
MAKALSLKLDDSTYEKAEQIRKRLKLPRNTYIRKAVNHYNSLYARKLVEGEYRKASRRLGAAHLEYLKETELLEDLPEDV